MLSREAGLKSGLDVNWSLVCDWKQDHLATHAFIAFLSEE